MRAAASPSVSPEVHGLLGFERSRHTLTPDMAFGFPKLANHISGGSVV